MCFCGSSTSLAVPQVLSSSSFSDGRRSVEVHASTVGDCSSQMSLLAYGILLLSSKSLQMCVEEAAALPLQYLKSHVLWLVDVVTRLHDE
eukprot:CAMPEP_0201689568 /NCGR_PEP_ID=MMETSP0578-20130828/3145_1 /ASSEMBLY_ACC=CAM_ASM_000663 /TAXON_ID=267565 /ORGANISM="Skeletonema grethea, Strain CCMP 1804" /LENGTH=89 /DNA_ID=CAMNT_0048174251 /DNA_START=1 /DNA_END=267 /DNA_ORIENTATION=+